MLASSAMLQAVSRQANAQSEIVAEQITLAQVPHSNPSEQNNLRLVCEWCLPENVYRLDEMRIGKLSGPGVKRYMTSPYNGSTTEAINQTRCQRHVQVVFWRTRSETDGRLVCSSSVGNCLVEY